MLRAIKARHPCDQCLVRPPLFILISEHLHALMEAHDGSARKQGIRKHTHQLHADWDLYISFVILVSLVAFGVANAFCKIELFGNTVPKVFADCSFEGCLTLVFTCSNFWRLKKFGKILFKGDGAYASACNHP